MPLITGWNPERLRTYAGERIPAYLSAKKNEPAPEQFLRSYAGADIRGHLPAHIAPRRSATRDTDDHGGSLERTGGANSPAARNRRRCGTAGGVWELCRNRLMNALSQSMTVWSMKITKASSLGTTVQDEAGGTGMSNDTI